ncbi:hypothetical protein [Flavimarina sp. Hel_I_48]|uniref:hypothetical protein n=1 Tax=Flavimarina sp. Hel_I_48 TaxID=1392488 RepID=UPI0013DB982A|nr:hypothetical protein [Flavimarina sp. Hel_I_48]
MKQVQLLGLGLIILSGALSQFTGIKQVEWGVWAMAILAMVGMILVMYNWFKTWK